MNHNAKKNLKKVIDAFLHESTRIVNTAENQPDRIQARDLEIFAEKIWDLRHFALELLDQFPDESTWYNASIIKELIDEPLDIDPEGKVKVSLIQAADLAKKTRNDKTLRMLLRAWTIESAAREVLFSNLRDISRELAA